MMITAREYHWLSKGPADRIKKVGQSSGRWIGDLCGVQKDSFQRELKQIQKARILDE